MRSDLYVTGAAVSVNNSCLVSVTQWWDLIGLFDQHCTFTSLGMARGAHRMVVVGSFIILLVRIELPIYSTTKLVVNFFYLFCPVFPHGHLYTSWFQQWPKQPFQSKNLLKLPMVLLRLSQTLLPRPPASGPTCTSPGPSLQFGPGVHLSRSNHSGMGFHWFLVNKQDWEKCVWSRKKKFKIIAGFRPRFYYPFTQLVGFVETNTVIL